jgi:hypothetical protein
MFKIQAESGESASGRSRGINGEINVQLHEMKELQRA